MNRYDHDHFERLYQADADPWQFRSSPYEDDKYARTLASLARPRYAKALELGCSIGVLTQRLAGVCDTVVAVDTSARALAMARESCRRCANVDFVQAHLPGGEWGTGFDLVVLSEILYYLDIPALARLAKRLGGALADGAECIAVHWTGDTDYPLSGDLATERFMAMLPGAKLPGLRTRHYRLDSWRPSADAAGQGRRRP